MNAFILTLSFRPIPIQITPFNSRILKPISLFFADIQLFTNAILSPWLSLSLAIVPSFYKIIEGDLKADENM